MGIRATTGDIKPDDHQEGPVCVLLRAWLPDRPGALGAVASRIGAVRGDIVGLDVLERIEGVAIDEFGILLPSSGLLPLLVREVEQVDGTRVEHAAVVDHFPDPRLDALTSVAFICEADNPADLREALVTYVGHALLADWVALIGGEGVLEAWGQPPDARHLLSLADGTHPAQVASGAAGPPDLASAALSGRRATLLVGRSANDFRARERAQIKLLAGIADHLWGRLAQAQPAMVSAVGR